MSTETITKNKMILDRKKLEIIFTIIYLSLFFAIAMSVASKQPLADTPPIYANAPDEHSRYLVPQYIYEHGTIPSGYDEAVRIEGYGSSYALYNVFPYIIMGFVMRFVGLFTTSPVAILMSARMVNVICGLVMAFVVRLIGKRVFKEDVTAWLFAALVTFWPQCLFIHTYVNTDSMCLMSTALIVYGLIRMYQDDINIKNSIILVIGIICCALSYYNAYMYILSAILLFLMLFKNGKEYDTRKMLRFGIPIAIAVLMGIAWWFIHNAILYDGDFLGLATGEKMQQMFGAVKPSMKEQGFSFFQMLGNDEYLSKLINSFIAAYGSMSIKPSPAIITVYKGLVVLGLLGYVSLIFRYIKDRTFKRMFFHINMILCIVVPIVLTLYYAYAMDYQYQGRYLLPIIVPFMYYVAKGYERIMELCSFVPAKIKRAIVCVIIAALVLILMKFVYGNAMPIYNEIGMIL